MGMGLSNFLSKDSSALHLQLSAALQMLEENPNSVFGIFSSPPIYPSHNI
jgi:hypothetical protein